MGHMLGGAGGAGGGMSFKGEREGILPKGKGKQRDGGRRVRVHACAGRRACLPSGGVFP